MKKSLLYLLLASLPVVGFSQTIRYVKAGATGANDGTSWANAYTNLETALDAAANGTQIWVAAGKYTPPATPANGSFLAATQVKLYGGFVGTETSLNQRNPTLNVTTLSGDLAGDDITGDFTQKRTDNSWHVLVVSSDPQYTSTVDGFKVVGGNTKIATADPDLDKRGGGILATTPVIVRNCVFTDNAALTGSSVACIGAQASNSLIDNCLVEKNLSTSQCAGVHFRQLTAGEVNHCIFRNNTTTRGCFYPNACKSIVVDSCLFENNKQYASGNFGVGAFTWQTSFKMTNCIFRGNESDNGGGMYNDGRDGGNFFTIDNCLFENNNALDYGGTGVFNNKCNFLMRHCSFKGNKAPTSAAGMYNGGGCNFRVEDCNFEQGSASFGGAVANYGKGTLATYDGCVFKDNSAVTSGGAMINGFIANVTVKNSTFSGNMAKFGGAMFSQNDSTALTIDSTSFSGNAAVNNGGAVNIGAGIAATIKHTSFELNSGNYGGGMEVSEDSLNLSKLDLQNCIFRDNFGQTQAAGLNVNNVDVTMSNCLFYNNINSGTGAGGALSNNASSAANPVSTHSSIKAVNCTFAANDATLGAGIAQWQDSAGVATLTLQNCIFQNLKNNYDVEDGTPTVISLGGNLSADASMTSLLNGTNDRNDVDPAFVDGNNFNFELTLTSPCVDKGIAAGAPPTDLLGRPRKNAPDMGALENQNVVGVGNPNVPIFRLSVAPNPAVDFVELNLASAFSGQLEVTVTNAAGQLVHQFSAQKMAGAWAQRLAVEDLAAGVYRVRVISGQGWFVGSFVKN